MKLISIIVLFGFLALATAQQHRHVRQGIALSLFSAISIYRFSHNIISPTQPTVDSSNDTWKTSGHSSPVYLRYTSAVVPQPSSSVHDAYLWMTDSDPDSISSNATSIPLLDVCSVSSGPNLKIDYANQMKEWMKECLAQPDTCLLNSAFADAAVEIMIFVIEPYLSVLIDIGLRLLARYLMAILSPLLLLALWPFWTICRFVVYIYTMIGRLLITGTTWTSSFLQSQIVALSHAAVLLWLSTPTRRDVAKSIIRARKWCVRCLIQTASGLLYGTLAAVKFALAITLYILETIPFVLHYFCRCYQCLTGTVNPFEEYTERLRVECRQLRLRRRQQQKISKELQQRRLRAKQTSKSQPLLALQLRKAQDAKLYTAELVAAMEQDLVRAEEICHLYRPDSTSRRQLTELNNELQKAVSLNQTFRHFSLLGRERYMLRDDNLRQHVQEVNEIMALLVDNDTQAKFNIIKQQVQELRGRRWETEHAITAFDAAHAAAAAALTRLPIPPPPTSPSVVVVDDPMPLSPTVEVVAPVDLTPSSAVLPATPARKLPNRLSAERGELASYLTTIFLPSPPEPSQPVEPAVPLEPVVPVEPVVPPEPVVVLGPVVLGPVIPLEHVVSLEPVEPVVPVAAVAESIAPVVEPTPVELDGVPAADPVTSSAAPTIDATPPALDFVVPSPAPVVLPVPPPLASPKVVLKSALRADTNPFSATPAIKHAPRQVHFSVPGSADLPLPVSSPVVSPTVELNSAPAAAAPVFSPTPAIDDTPSAVHFWVPSPAGVVLPVPPPVVARSPAVDDARVEMDVDACPEAAPPIDPEMVEKMEGVELSPVAVAPPAPPAGGFVFPVVDDFDDGVSSLFDGSPPPSLPGSPILEPMEGVQAPGDDLEMTEVPVSVAGNADTTTAPIFFPPPFVAPAASDHEVEMGDVPVTVPANNMATIPGLFLAPPTTDHQVQRAAPRNPMLYPPPTQDDPNSVYPALDFADWNFTPPPVVQAPVVPASVFLTPLPAAPIVRPPPATVVATPVFTAPAVAFTEYPSTPLLPPPPPPPPPSTLAPPGLRKILIPRRQTPRKPRPGQTGPAAASLPPPPAPPAAPAPVPTPAPVPAPSPAPTPPAAPRPRPTASPSNVRWQQVGSSIFKADPATGTVKNMNDGSLVLTSADWVAANPAYLDIWPQYLDEDDEFEHDHADPEIDAFILRAREYLDEKEEEAAQAKREKEKRRRARPGEYDW